MHVVSRVILAALLASLAPMAQAQEKSVKPAEKAAAAPLAKSEKAKAEKVKPAKASDAAAPAPKASTAPALTRVTLGWGRFFNNDLLGDGYDRWRTSSYSVSRLRGPEGTTELPSSLGQVVEFRLRLEQITAADLSKPAKKDRRYAGIASLGFHTHAKWRAGEVSLGTDLALIGPQTGMSRLQDVVHNRIGLPSGEASYSTQFANDAVFSATGEFGRPIAFGPSGQIRPFIEGQIGLENIARVGLDMTFGNLGKDGIMLRDSVTGQRYNAVQGPASRGLSLTVGADIANVGSSYLLPEGGAVTAAKIRKRLRAGLNWQGEKSFVFFGMTRLSPEFDEQFTDQTVGSLSLNVRF